MNLGILGPIAPIWSCRVTDFGAVTPGSLGIAGIVADGDGFRWPVRLGPAVQPPRLQNVPIALVIAERRVDVSTSKESASRRTGTPHGKPKTRPWQAQRVRHHPLVHRAAAFSPDAHAQFTIDRVSVSCSLPWFLRKRLRVRQEVWETLENKKAIKRVDNRLVVVMDPHFTVGVGRGFGVDGAGTGLVTDNVMRRLRGRLVAGGHYPAGEKAPGARGDNFVDPAHLADGVDLHAEAIAELADVVAEAQVAYAEAVRDLFGRQVDPAAVEVAIAQIELNWDVSSPLALAVSSLWWPSWRDACRGAGLGLDGGDDERLGAGWKEATEQRELDAMVGTGVLQARATKGCGYKLYAKHDRLMRFEATFTGDRAQRILGHGVRLLDREALLVDLERLGQRAYRTIMRAQDNLTCELVMSLVDMIVAFQPPAEGRKLRAILAAFEAGQKFQHTGRSHERLLARMREHGLAQHLERGLWAPTPVLNRSFRMAQYLRARSEGPA